jgi:hypothetical protein
VHRDGALEVDHLAHRGAGEELDAGGAVEPGEQVVVERAGAQVDVGMPPGPRARPAVTGDDLPLAPRMGRQAGVGDVARVPEAPRPVVGPGGAPVQDDDALPHARADQRGRQREPGAAGAQHDEGL